MDGGTQPSTQKLQPVKTEIHLEPRPGDRPVDSRLLAELDLFRRMQKKISAEKLPGCIVLRKYSKGQIIFQQGQAGGTAFYIPSADDLNRLREFDKDLPIPLIPSDNPERDRQVLTAVIVPSTSRTRSKGFFERLFSPSTKTPSRQVNSIPSDGPTDINYKTREAPLMEGDIFGEMSCISFTPRSATVIARVDCLLLEFNRNVFESLRDDKNHQAAVDKEYRRRTLDTHLRQFQIFSGLTESQIQTLKDNVTLEIVPPGKVICEEGEPWSDSKPLDVFIVRNGVVQVIANTNLSLQMDDIRDWTAFCRQLSDSQPEAPKVSPKPVVSPVVRTTGDPSVVESRPRSIPESAAPPQVVIDKGSAAAATSAPLQGGSATKKLSPLEQMRARKAAEANAQESPAAAGDQPATSPAEAKSEEPAAPQKKLSPIEQMRARKAAEANAQESPAAAGDQPATSSAEAKSEEPAAPQKKLSPIEQMRARKAAEANAQESPVAAGDQPATSPAEAKSEEPVAPQKKLSPIEQMRARKAAEANAQESPAAAGDPPATSPAEAKPEEPVAPQKQLSPIEQMRARKAAEANAQESPAAAGDQPATSSAEAKPEEPAVPQKKPSPLEQMRAKKAATGSDPVPPESPAHSAASGQTPSPSGETGPSTRNLDAPPTPSGKPTSEVDSTRPLLKEKRSGTTGSLVFLVKSWLNDHVLDAAQQIGNQKLTGEPLVRAQELILSALNQLLGRPDFLNDDRMIADVYVKPELLRKVATFPKGTKGIKDKWSELELRTAGRAAFSEIFPKLIRQPVESSGPPRVLAYLSRGECFGEIAVVTRSPRNASCIAYNHPSTEEARDFGNVELVRIPGAAFRQLMDESPALKQQVESLAQTRVKQTKSSGSTHTESDLIASADFQQMGLFQGTRLLVIDLDSCTRCGDCVEACVKTHDDGYSRLFLDGPRYDRFLVPSACRNCLNPVCMLGCPVGSIARGNNGQIEIYDWCIGCSKCAEQCPYDSIQMHDLGLIPEESLGWLCASRRSLPDDWYQARRLGGGWMQGSSPFLWQGDFLRNLIESVSDSESSSICFRHEFRLPKKSKTTHYRLSVNEDKRKSTLKKVRVEKSKVLGVWLNGKKLALSGNSIDLATEDFQANENLLAVEVSLDANASYGSIVLSACLDAVPEASAQTRAILGDQVLPEMDLVTSRAAVCDLCSHLPSQQPACVSSCPHDAAIRINPLINFPK